MFYCRFCTFTTKNLKQHLNHRKLHSNLSSNIFCGFGQCRKPFKSEGSLRIHLIRSHGFRIKHAESTSRAPPISRLENINANYMCNVKLCKKVLDTQHTFVKHLKDYIRDGANVECPYQNCTKLYHKLNSFTSHLSKSHKNLPLIDSSVEITAGSSRDQISVVEDNIEVDTCCTGQQSDDQVEETLNIFADDPRHASPVDPFLLHLGQFFLKLEGQFMIPVSTIQYIVSQICSIHEHGQEIVKNNLPSRCSQENIPPNQASVILHEVFNKHPFQKIQNEFGTSYKRREFYKKHFPYVKPIKVWLGDKSDGKNFFHYVPIDKTIKQLFNNKSLEDELQRGGSTQSENNTLRDFVDGSVYKQNPFFQKNPNGLKLILYQDSFEVVNPIGSAKTKYKILAVYLNIGNLPDHVRSHTNSMQLVALCREKLFDHKKVYGRIVNDLKKIETEGVELASGKVIVGTLVFIAGDNLGSHSLGGFVENFSTSAYFCRYCLMKRSEFYSKDGVFKTYENRSVDSYNQIIKAIETERVTPAFNNQGIKFNSEFNKLQFYHVAAPGLPPCLGHDVLEGIIAYDVKLFIDYFVKMKWFSYEFLNKRINSFKYSEVDRRDKPCTVSQAAKKITGGAWQLRTFLRLFPLLIEDKIANADDDVWKCVILLTEIIEIICAPEIHKSCIPYLRLVISEYIELRQKFEKPIRPKHHFLLHYPELILQFGPLMKVWTLRFESKHTFFKRVIRFVKNFINVTKSLSIKHELYQSFIRSGGDIRCDIEMIGNTTFVVELYNEQIQEAVRTVDLPGNMQECTKIVVKGVCYKKGDGLFVSQEGYQYEVKIGRVLILLCDEDNIFIILEVLETVFRPHLRVYELGKFLRYECVQLDSLPSTEKLHIYNIGNQLCVKPNYGLVRKPL